MSTTDRITIDIDSGTQRLESLQRCAKISCENNESTSGVVGSNIGLATGDSSTTTTPSSEAVDIVFLTMACQPIEFQYGDPLCFSGTLLLTKNDVDPDEVAALSMVQQIDPSVVVWNDAALIQLGDGIDFHTSFDAGASIGSKNKARSQDGQRTSTAVHGSAASGDGSNAALLLSGVERAVRSPVETVVSNRRTQPNDMISTHMLVSEDAFVAMPIVKTGSPENVNVCVENTAVVAGIVKLNGSEYF